MTTQWKSIFGRGYFLPRVFHNTRRIGLKWLYYWKEKKLSNQNNLQYMIHCSVWIIKKLSVILYFHDIKVKWIKWIYHSLGFLNKKSHQYITERKSLLPNIRIFSLTTVADNDFSRWSNFKLKRVYKNYQKAKKCMPPNAHLPKGCLSWQFDMTLMKWAMRSLLYLKY